VQRRLRWILSKPLLFGEESSGVCNDLESFHEILSLSVRLRDLSALGPERLFVHRASTLLAGDLAISSCIASPFQAVAEESDEATVVIHRAGAMIYDCEGLSFRLHGESQVIYLPGAAARSQAGASGSSGIVFNLNPALLAREICFLSRERLPLERAMLFLQQPMIRDPSDPAVGAVLRRLLELLSMQPAHLSYTEGYQRLVGARLEIAVYRALALILRPDLIV
jgi:hypothetical protein